MNIAVMLAGGTGERMGAGRPKQFIENGHKPLILHCLDIYEQSPDIDAIEVVCHKDWIDYTWELVKEWNITKVKWVCEGGDTCQVFTRSGIFNLEGEVKDDDVLMFVMSSSPFVNDEIIKDSLRVCREHGSAFACMPSKYNLAYTEDGTSSCHINFKEQNKTIYNNPNVKLVFCGHCLTPSYINVNYEINAIGAKVYMIEVNYQHYTEGGQGCVALLDMVNDRKYRIRSYSTYYNKYTGIDISYGEGELL